MNSRSFWVVYLGLGFSFFAAGCGGGSSSSSGGNGGGGNTVTPTVSSISPTSVMAGSGPLTLTVNGTGYLSTTTIQVGGIADQTTYVSGTQVTATVEPAQLVSGGTFSVIALNGTVTSGSGAAVSLTVNNPAPVISALAPSTEPVGATSPVVSVTGTGFVPTTVIDVNGSARTTTYVSGTQVNVLLNASDVAAAGNLSLTATNGTPGGGTSTAATLVVSGSVAPPTVTSISPSSVTAGSGPVTLTVNGAGFSSLTLIEVGGVVDLTSYLSSSQVTATVEPAQLLSGGTLSVIALEGSLTSGSDAPVNLTVNNPLPVITALTPPTLYVGAAVPLAVTVAGSGFVPTTVVDVNGSARTTNYVSGTQVSVVLNASDVATAGSLSLTAVNAAPGGGTSAASTLAVNNPAPGALIKISPTIVTTGAAAPTTVTVMGTNFVPASTVEVEAVPFLTSVGTFAGSARATTYISSTQLTFQLTVADQATSQEVLVEVVNPSPGGGTTRSQTLTVLPQTPTPVITQVQPTQFYVQEGAATIEVIGTNLFSQISTGPYTYETFATSTVFWNGTALSTQSYGSYSSTSEYIFATVPAGLLSSAGPATITVSSATSTPAVSNALTVTVSNPPVPTLTSIAPDSGLVNTAATVTLTGIGFAPDSTVAVNGTVISSEYASSTILYATIPASDLASPGTVDLTVTTPAPGGGTSAALPFTASYPPAPTLTSIYPSGGPVNSAASISLSGTGFTSGSTVAVNGVTIASQYLAATEITATIPAADIALPGNLNITVTTPSPGGGTTSPLLFTAFLGITNNDIAYDASNGLLYASIPGTVSGIGNSVIGIDPVTGNIESQIFVGSNPDKLSLSTDGTQLFVGLDGGFAVAQVNLSTGQVVDQFSLGSNSGYEYPPYNTIYLAAVPGETNSVAVSNYTTDFGGGVVAIYDSGVARANTSAPLDLGAGQLAFGSSASTLYLANGETVDELTVGATGITASSTFYDSTYDLSNVQYDSGNLYLSSGEVLNATTAALLGSFYASTTSPATGPIVSDSALGLAFIGYSSAISGTPALLAFNETTYDPTGSIPVNDLNTSSYPYNFDKIVLWGQDGLAANTSTQIYIFQSPIVQNLSSSPADLSVTLAAPATATTGTAISYLATITNNGPNTAQAATLSMSLDSSLIINSITPSQGTCGTGYAFNCDLGDLTSGSSATVTVSATPTVANTLAGLANVTSVSYDPVTTNNQATTSTTVAGSTYSPAPVIASISPNLVQAGSAAFTLTVNGAGFNSASTVNLGGTALTTSFVSSTQLTAEVDASSIANYGWTPVTVSNPTPGGGTSGIAPLTIFALVNVPANAIVLDPFGQQIYATVPSASTTVTGNSIVAINPATAAVGTPVLVGSEPNQLAETSDGDYLYIGLNGADSLVQFNLASQSVQATITLLNPEYNPPSSFAPTALATMPGTDTSLAVSDSGYVGILDVSGSTGTFRTDFASLTDPVFSSPTELYAANGDDFNLYTVNASGLTLVDSTPVYGLVSYSGGFDLAAGIVYGGAGGIINPSTTPPSQIALLDFSAGSGVGAVADPSTYQDFIMLENAAGTSNYGLTSFNITNYLAEQTLVMPTSASSFESTWTMLRWGQAGLALLSVPDSEISEGSVAEILLLEGPFVTPQLLQTDTAATLTSSSTSSITHGAGNTVLTLSGTNFQPGVAITWNGSYRTTTLVNSQQVTVAIPASDLASAGTGSLVATNPGASSSNTLTVTIN